MLQRCSCLIILGLFKKVFLKGKLVVSYLLRVQQFHFQTVTFYPKMYIFTLSFSVTVINKAKTFADFAAKRNVIIRYPNSLSTEKQHQYYNKYYFAYSKYNNRGPNIILTFQCKRR